MRFAFRITALAIVLAACDGGSKVDPPLPLAKPDVDSMPTLPPSLIEAPLTYDLTSVVASLEAAVPKTFGVISERRPHPTNKRVHFAFAGQREPFVIKLDGDTVRMSAVINYAGRVWYNPPLLKEIHVDCGIHDPQQPRARVEIVTPIRLSADWKLRSHTTVRTVAPYSTAERDQCELTAAHINVTDRVIAAARTMLESNTKVIDAKIASIDLRSKFEQWWAVLQKPIELTDTVWLAINPKAVHVGTPSGTRRMLHTAVGLTAEPRIVVGKKPVVNVTPLPRQIVETDEAPGHFHVLIEGVLPYDVASKLMTKQLRGQKISSNGRSIAVRNIRMFGVGGNKIALQVDFNGDAKGRVYFLGTPHYDYVADRLYVPDLEYDVATESVLVRGVSWLKHDDLKEYLRTKARWPVGGLIKQAHEQLDLALNRELAPGVRLSGNANDVEVINVHAGGDAVRVRAHADGVLKLDVRAKK